MFSLSDAIAQLIFIGLVIIIGWAIFSLMKREKEKVVIFRRLFNKRAQFENKNCALAIGNKFLKLVKKKYCNFEEDPKHFCNIRFYFSIYVRGLCRRVFYS